MRSRPRPLIALLASVGALALAGPAQAGPSQISIMSDDTLLLDRGAAEREAALVRMKELGVDYARVRVEWSEVARGARSGRARRRFRGDDPATYPARNWDALDGVVRAAQAVGIGVHLVVAGPGPAWAHAAAPRRVRREDRGAWKPDPTAFGRFARAVGARYSGAYTDENEGEGMLPRVGFWSLYDEPNGARRLLPQYERRHGRTVAWSPVMYRELWAAGRAALDATGHGGDVVLIGETVALGSSATNPDSPMRPKRFIRELFCVAPDGARYTGRDARDRRCSALARIGELRVAAWAHHPSAGKAPPTRRDLLPDSITMANIGELGVLLDEMAATTQRIAPRTSTIVTAFGYETSPPDPFVGVTLAEQAAFSNVGERLAFIEDRIIGFAQSGLRDEPAVRGASATSRRSWSRSQSGLVGLDGADKPAAAAYALPLTVESRDGGLALWGQLRFLPNGTASGIALQFRPRGAAEFATAGGPEPVTSPLGFFEARRTDPGPGTWRALWTNPADATTRVSREVEVG